MDTLGIFNKFKSIPLGTKLFTSMLCKKAPYFGSISPTIKELRPAYALATMKNTRKVQNHLKTVHAIAMCNLAELVGGMMTEVSLPPTSRWIPMGMTVEYLKKAKTDLIGIADGSNIDWSTLGDVVVPVTIKDTDQNTVFKAEIKMRVSPKPKR